MDSPGGVALPGLFILGFAMTRAAAGKTTA
jgi:hypothetical protein